MYVYLILFKCFFSIYDVYMYIYKHEVLKTWRTRRKMLTTERYTYCWWSKLKQFCRNQKVTGKIVYPQVEQFVRFSDQHRKNLLLVIVAISYRYTIAVHLNIYSADNFENRCKMLSSIWQNIMCLEFVIFPENFKKLSKKLDLFIPQFSYHSGETFKRKV